MMGGKPTYSGNCAGPLREILAEACEAGGFSMRELTILDRDPYRLDTPANNRDGQWFAAQIARFVTQDSTVHLRGLHYLIASSGDVVKPADRRLYVNSDDDWVWLSEHAARAGRWLGYVPFERILDARNEEAALFAPEYFSPPATLIASGEIELPEVSDLMRCFHVPFHGRQHYRIVLITEKSSMSPILQPIAEMVGGESLSMTGETSDTRIAELAKRAAADGRPTVVLYFSDHDPSGWQMPISVSRKLQALRDLLYPDLDIQVRRAALTVEQANELDLPSTPLKETEKRAANWRDRTGREQTELDALIALRPDALRRFALEAIEPFFDATLSERVGEAAEEWHDEANARLAAHPKYPLFAKRIKDAQAALKSAAKSCNELVRQAYNALSKVKPPSVHVPEPEVELPEDGSEPVFSTDEDFVSATLRLKAQKALEKPEPPAEAAYEIDFPDTGEDWSWARQKSIPLG